MNKTKIKFGKINLNVTTAIEKPEELSAEGTSSSNEIIISTTGMYFRNGFIIVKLKRIMILTLI